MPRLAVQTFFLKSELPRHIKVFVPAYEIDLDPTHLVLRITLRNVVTDQVVLDAYRSMTRLAARGGPYATIGDCSGVKNLKVSADTIRPLALGAPAIPGNRPRVVVVNSLVMYGLARMFESTRTSMDLQFHVVWSVDEAYTILGISPDDFSERLFPEILVA